MSHIKFYKIFGAFGFLSEFIFIYPLYNLMFKDYGASPIVISALLITAQISKMLNDIPMGFLADRYNRKNILLLGQIFRFISCFSWLIYPSYTSFFIGMFFWGAAMACIFGKTESYLYEQMKAMNRKSSFGLFLGIYYALQNIAIFSASMIGAHFLKEKNYHLPLLLTCFFLLLGMFVLSLLPPIVAKEDNFPKKHNKKASFLSLLYLTFSDKKVSILGVLIIFGDIVFFLFFELTTILMAHMGYNGKLISYVVAFNALSRIMSNFISAYLAKKIISPNTTKLVIIIYLTLFTLFNIFAFKENVGLVMTLSVFLNVYCYTDLILKREVQGFLPSEIRASVFSCFGVIISLLSIVSSLVMGIIGEKYGYFVFNKCLGIIMLIFLITVSIVSNIKSKHRHRAGTS